MATSLSLTVGLLTLLNGETESIDPDLFKLMLCDSAKLQVDAVYKESESRKAFITPNFPDIRDTLEQAKPDNDFLYGAGLEKSISGTEYVCPQTQVLKALTNTLQNRVNPFLSKKRAQRPQRDNRRGQRPPRETTSARGRATPRLFLRSKSDNRGDRKARHSWNQQQQNRRSRQN